ncbi:MAG: signal peptidase I [Eggerthellaceae bacterium]|nr:signal peptidase I [Eggerthellaceae bacterium]
MNTLKRIWRVVSTVLVAVAVLLAVALVGVRLVGFEVYTVLSGSMEPAYHTGSVIWVQECEPEEVEVGDPITFVMNEDLLVATHRVIEIDEANQHFYTKGDANEAPDAAPVHFENLIGKPVFTVPHLGYFVSYIQQPPGLYVAIAACAFLLLLMFLPELFAKDEGPVEKQPMTARKPRADIASKSMARPAPTHAGSRPARTSPAPSHLQQQGHARTVPRHAAPQRQGPVGRPAAHAPTTQTNNPRLKQRAAGSRQSGRPSGGG